MKSHTTHENSAESFTGALETRLRRALPSGIAAAMTAEAEAHLSERIDDLTARGVGMADAESAAVSVFGSPNLYARRLIDGFYESSRARRARACGIVIISALFALATIAKICGDSAFFSVLNSAPYGFLSTPERLFGLLGCAAFAVVAFSFLGRRRNTRLIAACGAVYTGAAILATGLFTTTLPYNHQLVDRRNLRENIAWLRQRERSALSDIRKLDEGRAAYGTSARTREIPAELRVGADYLVPTIPDRNAIGIAESVALPGAFQASVPMSSDMRHKLAVPSGQTAFTFVTASTADVIDARRRWLADAGVWRAAKTRELASITREIGEYRAISPVPDGFDACVYWWRDLDPVFVTLLVVLLDLAGSFAGRRLYSIEKSVRLVERSAGILET